MLFLSWTVCIFAELLTKALGKKSTLCSDRGKFEGGCNKSLQFLCCYFGGWNNIPEEGTITNNVSTTWSR